jgi:predicted RNase H-like nuclease (RuvC/YqgF family)
MGKGMEHWIEVAVGLVTGVVGWFAGTKMRRAQTSSIEFENYKSFVETNNSIIESLRVQVTNLIRENSDLRTKVDKLEDEIRQVLRTYPCDNCPLK